MENDVYTVITSTLDVERHYIQTESLASLFKQVIGHLWWEWRLKLYRNHEGDEQQSTAVFLPLQWNTCPLFGWVPLPWRWGTCLNCRACTSLSSWKNVVVTKCHALSLSAGWWGCDGNNRLVQSSDSRCWAFNGYWYTVHTLVFRERESGRNGRQRRRIRSKWTD